MKKNINDTLNEHVPTLTQPERVRVWREVASALTVPREIPSPFYTLFRAHRGAFALALVVLILAGSGATVVKADTARPGDALFPLDQAVERVRMQLTRNDAKRTKLANAFTEERLAELRSIVEERHAAASTTVTAAQDDERVGAAVEALVRVMDDSHMSDVAREKVYGHLFTEIDDLSIDVRVDENKRETKNSVERVKIHRDDVGSKLEIRKEGMRTRIEKRDGEMHINRERERDDADTEVGDARDLEQNEIKENEDSQDVSDGAENENDSGIRSPEVRGATYDERMGKTRTKGDRTSDN